MARPRGVEPLTFWSVVKRSIQLSYGRCLCYSWWCWLDIHYGAAERTRTSTGLLLPAPQAGASTIPPRPHTAYSWHITMKLMERVKRIELSQSAWKAEVLPLNYTRLLLMGRLMGIEPTSVGATIRCVNHFATIAILVAGRGGRNRTHTNGFGDRCSTVKLHPYLSGAGSRTWTRNLLITSQLLYQLSYSGKMYHFDT